MTSAIYKENKILILISVLLSFLPVSLLIGTLISNSILIMISILFLFYCFIYKKFEIFKKDIFFLLLFFWIGLLLNFCFSEIKINSYDRTFGFLRFIFLSLAIFYIFNYKNEFLKEIILKIWSLTFLIIIIDLIFEFYTGKNLMGFSSNYTGRLASFTGEEVKIGNLYLALSFIFISYIFQKFKNLQVLILLLLFLTILSFLIGERANFVRFILLSFFFLSFIFFFRKKLKFFLFINLIFISILFTLYTYDHKQNSGNSVDTFQDRYYIRYVKELNRIQDMSLFEYIKKETRHGLHYYTAINIFKEYKITGVGLKNFREFSSKKKFTPDFATTTGHSTHPHQVYFEIMSEMGILGIFFFSVTFFYSIIKSIQNNLNSKYLIGISGSLYIVLTFLPLIPSGSFFTSYGATLFWINFGLMYCFKEKFN